MKFTKMHGIGNDYIYIDCLNQALKNPSKCAKLWSDRHFGIGSDGLVLILPSKIADFKMDIYNSDGSLAEMCGNAVRCIGKYLYENKLVNKDKILLETRSGIKELKLYIEDNKVNTVKVDMGVPILEPSKIPVNLKLDKILNYPLTIADKSYNINCVSMGNPHTVIITNDNLDNLDIKKLGPVIENHNLFPNRTNVEFINIIDKNNIKIRVWERGAGETLACGTGACASFVVSVLNNYCEREIDAHLKGGNLFLEWDKSNHIFMTGSATKVFEGEI